MDQFEAHTRTERPSIGVATGLSGLSVPFSWQGSTLRVVSGHDQVTAIGRHLRELGLTRAMLVSSPSTSSGWAARVIRQALCDRIVERFETVPPHSGEDTVADGVELARKAEIDCIIAVGGGSVSDTAKAILIVLAEGGEIGDHANVFDPPDRYEQKHLGEIKLPLIVVPTTASAAEVTPGLGIRARTGHKMVFWDHNVVPRLILLDPGAFSDTPAAVLAATGMNAFAHCVEGTYSRVANPISTALALHAARGLTIALPALARDPSDVGAKVMLMTAAHLSGHVISNARVGLHHAICHGLGSLGGMSHGDANAIMLPHVMRYNAEAAETELAMLAEAMGASRAEHSVAQLASDAISRVEALQSASGVPIRLRDRNLNRSLIPLIAQKTLSDRGAYFNPRPAPPEEDIKALLEAAW